MDEKRLTLTPLTGRFFYGTFEQRKAIEGLHEGFEGIFLSLIGSGAC